MVKKIFENNMKLEMDSVSENESLARMGVASFLTKIDPTLEEINDIKTAVSEAVTNSIIHGYRDKKGIVEIKCHLRETIIEKEDEILHISLITIIVRDDGTGIDDIEKAMEPMYTSKPENDRAGMGFAFMQLFMDTVDVWSKPYIGTSVTMTKELKRIEKKGKNGCNNAD